MSILDVASTQRSILLVDDELVIRELCAHALAGYRIVQAASGAQALAALEHDNFDLVLTDVMMPEMDGLELLGAIKARTPNQVVIIMTGYADKEIILKALKASADDFITKPLNLLQLRTIIEKALERQRLREEVVELKHMDRLKSEFLGLVSHKLKTPTTSVSLFLQNLADDAVDTSDSGFRTALTMVQKELSYLDYLIRDLLYYSDVILEDSSLRREQVEIGELLQNVLAELDSDATSRGISIEVPLLCDLPHMALDRKRMTFVLRALVENAIKFTPPGGRIEVTASVAAEMLHLRVKDSGTGIPEEERAKVFEKFYQVDPAHSGQVRGFGLGLYYARQFVHDHGGSIRLDPRPGGGTEATVLLPLT